MHVAALVPTRNRAATAERGIRSFLRALRASGLANQATIAICDDSDDGKQAAAAVAMVRSLASEFPEADLQLAPGRRDNLNRLLTGIPAGGPGATRNRGLALLSDIAGDADVTIMFDDDVVFGDTEYRGQQMKCNGALLLTQSLSACEAPCAVVGCTYVGRQDLSILEHARLAMTPTVETMADPSQVIPAIDRRDIEYVAPGGISTAFLAIGVSPSELPAFPEHYNEDYVWLQALARAGWPLRRVSEPIIHAPPGDVVVTAEALSFQVHGEIVWLAILERDRFPVEDHEAMAAAVTEIAGDLRSALNDPAVIARPYTEQVVRDVLGHCITNGQGFTDRMPTTEGKALITAIRAGLSMTPPALGRRPSTAGNLR